ncbi:MAG: bifunctional homocysteine S-methyltransferase/methylenetetrahydrofolate reductase [Pseudomonadota bacterium]
MKKDFLKELIENGILADGAIGTEIYNRGVFIHRSYDELNLTNPELIKEIHLDYLKAGAGFLTTNTFTANRLALASFGLEDKVIEINKKGAQLAKSAAGDGAYVGGSVGPVKWAAKTPLSDEKIKEVFREQIQALAEEGVDAIIFETFLNLEELKLAYDAGRQACQLPLITQVSLKYVSEEEGFAGLDPADAARTMESWGADVIGVNCSDGPQGVFEAVKLMIKATSKPLSAMPNAGLPRMMQGRLMYLASPEYFAEYARRYAQLGVSLIGGCCGTTPAHIKEMKKYLKAITPGSREKTEKIEVKKPRLVRQVPAAEKSKFGATFLQKFSISVEVDPPLGINPKKALEGARLLKDLGVDAVNIADGPRAMARMSPMALGVLIKEQVGIEPIVHYCCRDRNLLGMQMDLIGAAALGLNNVLLITGDPPKMGNYPDATAVFDIDSIGLIGFVANLNQGLDFSDRPLKEATNLLIGCGVNPGAVDLDLEVERYKQKVAAGAEFVFCQPVFDNKLLLSFFERIKDVPQIPFFAGIMPLVSLRNAEFLHNEVPGMQVPEEIMQKMAAAKTKEAQKEVGLRAAKEALLAAKELSQVSGAYIFPPLGNYQLVADLLSVLK